MVQLNGFQGNPDSCTFLLPWFLADCLMCLYWYFVTSMCPTQNPLVVWSVSKLQQLKMSLHICNIKYESQIPRLTGELHVNNNIQQLWQ